MLPRKEVISKDLLAVSCFFFKLSQSQFLNWHFAVNTVHVLIIFGGAFCCEKVVFHFYM